jgi:malonyl-CoA O-methyltransferase
VITVDPRQAYRLWAPTYCDETAISVLENDLANVLSPPLAGKRLLDAGCGTGRRLAGEQAALAIGVDICCEMLLAGNTHFVAVADVRTLPFPSAAFDVVWCRLVIGHVREPRSVYRELARVCRAGGTLFISDFHPDAVAAGHCRSFRDQSGQLYAVEHHVHDAKSQIESAAEAGLAPRAQQDGRIGPRVESFYRRAGRGAAYERDCGLPVVAAFLFERTADATAYRSIQ